MPSKCARESFDISGVSFSVRPYPLMSSRMVPGEQSRWGFRLLLAIFCLVDTFFGMGSMLHRLFVMAMYDVYQVGLGWSKETVLYRLFV